MKILDYFKEIPKIFDWYFLLTPIKRIQLNYIVLLVILSFLTYKNDEQHKQNYILLSNRIDVVNNSRATEQEKYTKSLQYYTEKFNRLLEILLEQKREKEQLKK